MTVIKPRRSHSAEDLKTEEQIAACPDACFAAAGDGAAFIAEASGSLARAA